MGKIFKDIEYNQIIQEVNDPAWRVLSNTVIDNHSQESFCKFIIYD